MYRLLIVYTWRFPFKFISPHPVQDAEIFAKIGKFLRFSANKFLFLQYNFSHDVHQKRRYNMRAGHSAGNRSDLSDKDERTASLGDS
jgi:hypothetical protein